MTPDSELELAFDPSVVPAHMHTAHLATHELHLRPLASTDDSRGHMTALADLTHAPSLTHETYLSIFNSLKASSLSSTISSSSPTTPSPSSCNVYYPVVLVHKPTDNIVACATLFLEQKFIRNGGKVGHIEDVVVVASGASRGKGLGKVMVDILTQIALQQGAYKVILDCDDKNVGEFVCFFLFFFLCLCLKM